MLPSEMFAAALQALPTLLGAAVEAAHWAASIAIGAVLLGLVWLYVAFPFLAAALVAPRLWRALTALEKRLTR